MFTTFLLLAYLSGYDVARHLNNEFKAHLSQGESGMVSLSTKQGCWKIFERESHPSSPKTLLKTFLTSLLKCFDFYTKFFHSKAFKFHLLLPTSPISLFPPLLYLHRGLKTLSYPKGPDEELEKESETFILKGLPQHPDRPAESSEIHIPKHAQSH